MPFKAKVKIGTKVMSVVMYTMHNIHRSTVRSVTLLNLTGLIKQNKRGRTKKLLSLNQCILTFTG